MIERLNPVKSLFNLMFLSLLAVGTSPTVAAQPPEPLDLLTRMAQAAHQLNYDGTFVYDREGKMHSMRILHKVDEFGSTEYERLISLTGEAREILRDDETVTCVFPDQKSVMMDQSQPRSYFPKLSEEQVEQIGNTYSLAIVGDDRVAQRSTWVMDIRPRDGYRYGYRFWIDKNNHFLLRTSTFDNKGKALESIMFTHVDFPGEIESADLLPDISSDGYVVRMNISDAVDDVELSWHATWVPGGFELKNQFKPVADDEVAVEHQSWSDNLSSFSIFVELVESAADAIQGFTRIGSMVTYSRLEDKHQITVIGEVPPITVKRVADSVQRR